MDSLKNRRVSVQVSGEPITNLQLYAGIPIAFEVRSVLDVLEDDQHQGKFILAERKLDTPYVKDYDVVESPLEWVNRFDMSAWGMLFARSDGMHLGGAIVAFNTPGLDMLEARLDLAALWDIRVVKEARGQGVGSALFQAAEAWAITRGCRQLNVETQNNNVPACRFYSKQGCVLAEVHRSAYPEFPEEIQMIWTKQLSS